MSAAAHEKLCVNTEFVWELKRGFVKAVVSRAVRLRECPLRDRGTQRIVSVNYLFERTLIPYNFLKGIFSSNFPGMENLKPSVFGLIKMSFRVPKKGRLRFSERK